MPKTDSWVVYLLIALTILFTITGQLLIKSATQQLGQIPTRVDELVPFALGVYRYWKVIAGLGCGIIASFCWLGAVSRSNISFAYPFMGLAIVLVLLLSPLFFGETVPWTRWLGVGVVCLGIWIAAQ
jgi:drug/metabolite transporter (DMT)-like permease